MKSFITNLFFGVTEAAGFSEGITRAVQSVPRGGRFASDNLFTYWKTLSFFDDAAFMRAFETSATTEIERGIIWRTYTLCWVARNAMRLAGDFVEAACCRGTSARIVCDYVDFGSSAKRFFLYDLFEHPAGASHHAVPQRRALFADVKARFADLKNVDVIQGSVPEILQEQAPKQIAFLHLDLNNAEAELGALGVLFDRVVPYGVVILDDYGWSHYRAQKDAEDPFFEARGHRVLELPTGQGLVIKYPDGPDTRRRSPGVSPGVKSTRRR